MTHPAGLSEWTTCVSSHLPHLSKPQATVLAWWSFGIVFTRSCGRLTVATFLALLLGRKVATVEQRLYEWCVDADHKAGMRRRTLEPSVCFASLLRWVVHLWHGTQLPLTLDATSLGDRFVVLAVCVVFRGIGIPVAWCVLRAGQPRAWRREWLRLLRLLRPAVPSGWYVLVLADRGLYARWLFRRIVRLGWHPFLRINTACKFRPAGHARWYWLRDLCATREARYANTGTCFKDPSSHLACTLLAWWGSMYAEPWYILTDASVSDSTIEWYALRSWCEQGFKCTKRGGWQWQQTQMSDPERAERLWLAFAVAMIWTVSVGSMIEDGGTAVTPDQPDIRTLLGRNTQPRQLRHLRLGGLWLLISQLTQQELPLPTRLRPDPWPKQSLPVNTILPHQDNQYQRA